MKHLLKWDADANVHGRYVVWVYDDELCSIEKVEAWCDDEVR